MKNISLGQYLPGEGLLYRLDPRAKTGAAILFALALFCTSSFLSYIAAACWLAAAVFCSGLSPKLVFAGIKGLLGFICVTALFGVLFTPGTTVFQLGWMEISEEGLRLGGEIALRFAMFVAGTSLLTYTTSPLSLMDGIGSMLRPFRRLGLPSHELAMMMSVALRFVPIVMEETRKIIKAQTARWADFSSWNPLRRGGALIPLLVPLLLSAWRRADELSTAMDARCYHGGEGRTSWRKYRITGMDAGVLAGTAALFGFIVGLRWL